MTKLNQQSISFRGPSIWNSLLVSIKDKKQSVKTFAKKIPNYLACNPSDIEASVFMLLFAAPLSFVFKVHK